MTAEKIRDSFSWNETIHYARTDSTMLMALQVQALGEIAAQLAELNDKLTTGTITVDLVR